MGWRGVSESVSLPGLERGEAECGAVRQKRQERRLPLMLYIKNIMVLVHKTPLFTSKHHPCLPAEPQNSFKRKMVVFLFKS